MITTYICWQRESANAYEFSIYYSQIIISTFIVFLSSSLLADTVLIICDEPAGPRIDISYNQKEDTASEPEYTTDKYTGVNPIFIIEDSEPKYLRYKWGTVEYSSQVKK